MLNLYPVNIPKVQSLKVQRLAIWDKISFSPRIVPLIIHMNHFSYPLTIVQINIFEELQNIFPNQNLRPQTFEPAPPPEFLTIVCPPGLKSQQITVYIS